jgi:hypothetical protein
LAPLAFVSPQLVSGIIDGHAPSVAVTALEKGWRQVPIVGFVNSLISLAETIAQCLKTRRE